MAGSSNNPNLLTPKDLAELLKISPSSVYRLVDKRAIPFYKIGGVLRFNLSEILEFVSDCKIEPVKM